MAPVPDFLKLLDEMKIIHEKKNQDYASEENPFSNFEFAADLAHDFTGVNAVFVTLIGVKLARLAQLLAPSSRAPNNESIDDTMLDLCVYSGLWKCWVKKEYQP